MKIAFVIAEYYPDGAGSGRSVRLLAEGASQKEHEVIVICLTPEKQSRSEVLNGVKIYYLPMRNIYWFTNKSSNSILRLIWHIIDSYNIFAMHDLGKILDQEKPDVVNTSVIAGFSAGVFSAVKSRGIPLVHTLRDYYLMCPKSSMYRNGCNCEKICRACKPFALIRNHLSKRIDLYLANSDYVLRRHKRHGFIGFDRPAKVQFNMNENEQIASSKSININKNTVRIGFIGRGDQVKGLSDLIGAICQVESENWQLLIAGSIGQSYSDTLTAKYPDDRIKCLGFTAPDQFYKQIDILVCPSLYEEPLARVIYEAYQYALPVIASKTGGTPEIVAHEKTGLLYDARDIEALSSHIDRLINDPDLYEKLSKGAAEKAKNFIPSKIIDEFLGHLEEVVNA